MILQYTDYYCSFTPVGLECGIDSLEKCPADGIVAAISSITVAHKNDSLLRDAVASYHVICMTYISLECTEVHTQRRITSVQCCRHLPRFFVHATSNKERHTRTPQPGCILSPLDDADAPYIYKSQDPFGRLHRSFSPR